MVKIEDFVIWGLCRLLRLSTEGRKAGTDDVHHRVGFFFQQNLVRWWQLTFTDEGFELLRCSTQMYNFNNLISTYFIFLYHQYPSYSTPKSTPLRTWLGAFTARHIWPAKSPVNCWIGIISQATLKTRLLFACCLWGKPSAKVLQRIFYRILEQWLFEKPDDGSPP